jgi:2'-hydroxyisoflavone reductase
MDRRGFIASAAVTALSASSFAEGARKAEKPLRILLLGGTRFIGVHLTEFALQRGHSITFFNRGKTNPGRFPQVEKLTGDRDGHLDALKGKSWDAVIDTSGYVPRHVRLSAELLAPHVQQYLFVSSISVYPNFATPMNEDSPVAKMPDETVEKVEGQTYGPLKALCEKAAQTAMPGRTTILRPGLIVGPDDNTDRFTYWPARAARGGEMIAPNSPSDPIQFIDARDLAVFALDLLEQKTMGVYNVLSPPGKFTIGRLVDTSVGAANALVKPEPKPKPVWIANDFLEQQSVAPWQDMPVWIPPVGENAAGAQTSASRALKAGLRISDIERTVRDTLAWHLGRPQNERMKLKAGIAPEKEKAVLAAWESRKT